MQHGVIEGHNLTLRGNGTDIHDLHCRVEDEDGYRAVTSAWIPSPAEVYAIMQGQPVYVTLLLLDKFPPMRVGVKP